MYRFMRENHQNGEKSMNKDLLKTIRRNSRKDFNLNAMSLDRVYISNELFHANNHYDASMEIDKIIKKGFPFPIWRWPEVLKNSISYKMLSFKKNEPLIEYFWNNEN